MPAVSIASEYQRESVSRTASSSTASRPTRCSTSGAGTLPLRKPGSFSSRPSLRARCSTRPSTSSGGTSTCTRTRDSRSSVTVVFRAAGRFGDAEPSECLPVRHARHDTVPPHADSSRAFRSPLKRLETWLWTGPVGHFAGGALDFGQALARYLIALADREIPLTPSGRGRTIR